MQPCLAEDSSFKKLKILRSPNFWTVVDVFQITTANASCHIETLKALYRFPGLTVSVRVVTSKQCTLAVLWWIREMDDNILYPSLFTLFICSKKGLSLCRSTEEISGCSVEWYGYTVAIEMGARAPVAALSIKGHGMSGFSFLTTLIHPPHSLLSHLCEEALMKMYFSFVRYGQWCTSLLLSVFYWFASVKGGFTTLCVRTNMLYFNHAKHTLALTQTH